MSNLFIIALLGALIISLFSDTVEFYERNNRGSWYDFGFVLGILCIWGGGSCSASKISKPKKCEDPEWKEIGEKLEKKLKLKMKKWCEAENDEDWEEIGKKAEKKLKKKIKEWLYEE